MSKPRLSFGEIFNMSFGFLGIQFGFGLQLASMSAIYTKLGVDLSKMPILWLAGPMTGLIVQPMSPLCVEARQSGEVAGK